MSKINKWLQLTVEDNVPKLHTLPRRMTLCELTNDNYTCLVVVDMTGDIVPNTSIKVFRGTKLVYERPLLGVPSAISSLYTDYAKARTPVIATAIGSEVLFFRNLKPYFKYTLPELEVEEREQELWRQLPLVQDQKQPELIEQLKQLDLSRLTPKSQRLLQIQEKNLREDFIRQHADFSVERRGNIVAMCKLDRVSSNEQIPPSHLVLAVDNGEILVLETQGFAVVHRAKMCSYETTPSLLCVNGTYETHFYMVIASKYGSIYLLRKSAPEGQEICKLPEPACDMLLLPVDQTIMVTCMSKRLMCYSKKGKQLFCISLPARPLCMIPIVLMYLGLSLTCIALEGGKVQFYMQRNLVDEFSVSDSVISMCFGCLGLEEHVLTLVTMQGNVIFKVLKRQANFDAFERKVALSYEEQYKKHTVLDKTKKNSIFVEQANREKQCAKSTYSAFQAGLWRLRHLAASNMVSVIKSNESSISTSFNHASMKLTVEVCGLGQEVRLYLLIHNMSLEKIGRNMMIVIHADRELFSVQKSIINLPVIMPQTSLQIDFEVTVKVDALTKLPNSTLMVENSEIQIMLTVSGLTKPLIAATVTVLQMDSKT